MLQDKDPKHTSLWFKNCFKKKERNGDHVLMDLPPQSTALSFVEHVWKHLKGEKVNHRPTAQDYPWRVVNV